MPPKTFMFLIAAVIAAAALTVALASLLGGVSGGGSIGLLSLVVLCAVGLARIAARRNNGQD